MRDDERSDVRPDNNVNDPARYRALNGRMYASIPKRLMRRLGRAHAKTAARGGVMLGALC